jgi:chorismate mutase
MIEPIMYFGIGFLVATLLGLLFVPRIHNRAVRLTMRRLEVAMPPSIAEIGADKDQLRAKFSVHTQSDLHEHIENAGGRDSGAVAKFRADIRHLEAQLGVALEERSKLQREIAAMKRDAETTWAAERVEIALFRERINDVAAQGRGSQGRLKARVRLTSRCSPKQSLRWYKEGARERRVSMARAAPLRSMHSTITRARSPTAFVPCGRWLRARRPIEFPFIAGSAATKQSTMCQHRLSKKPASARSGALCTQCIILTASGMFWLRSCPISRLLLATQQRYQRPREVRRAVGNAGARDVAIWILRA